MDTLHILPQKDHFEICTVSGEAIHAVCQSGFDVAVAAPHLIPTAVSDVERCVAFSIPSRDECQVIHVVRVERKGVEVSEPRTLNCPPQFTLKCLHFHGTRLFVAGGGSTSQIGYFDLGSQHSEWSQIKLSFPHWDTRKEIDALLSINRQRMIAVDNIVYPKFLIDCEVAAEPRATKLIELPNHGTYESIKRAAKGTRWLAILSTTGSARGPGRHLSIMATSTMIEHGSLSVVPTSYRNTVAKWRFEGSKPEYREQWHAYWSMRLDELDQEECREWNDIAFCGDRLLIAAGDDGVGLLDLTRESPVRSRTSRSERFSRRCTSLVKYSRDGIPKDNHPVGFSPIDDRRTVVICQGENDYRHVVMTI